MRIVRALSLAVFVFAAVAEAATFTVSTTNDSGAGSLRQAILDANASVAVTDTIAFNIAALGVQTITPLTSLPTIADPVILDGYTQPGASPNTLAIGTDAVLLIEIAGTTAGGVGLWFTETASSSTLRGLAINRFNTGVYLDNADNCSVEGNYIGTDASGMIDRGNANYGLALDGGAENNTIGGMTPAARNVMSGTSSNVSISSLSTINNTILGNYIGLNAPGTASVPGFIGINVNSAGANIIGGAGSAANFISGNAQGFGAGIAISNPATGIQILGNTIGLGADGIAPVPNTVGIRISAGLSGPPTNITIGSSAAPNAIAHNNQEGILLQTTIGSAQGVRIDSNSIHDNGQLGIDIGDAGISFNDALDGDSGANQLQNFPIITAANALGGNLTVNGTLHSTPSSTFTVQLFHNAACDASGFGEGAVYLGDVTVATDSSGNAAYNATFNVPITTGVITATTIDPATGNTSEFTECHAVAVVAQPSATIGNITLVETNAGTTLATFTVFLSAAPPAGASISYAAVEGTATVADNDLVLASGNAVFAAGQTTQTIDITINGDTDVEPDETFFLNLTGATNATITDNQALAIIKSDDNLPVVTISDTSAPEGDSGTTPLTFTVTVTPAATFTVTAFYATSDGTAVGPGDYGIGSGSVIIDAGATTATFAVNANGDNMHELNETLVVLLYDASNATIGDSQATGTITNDDPVPTVTIGDPTVTEGNVGNTPMIFTATLSNPTYLTVSVPFTTAPSSADPSDYVAQTGSYTFLSPQVTRNLQISVIGDTTVELDETFFVNLGVPTNATIGDGQGLGTIVNDDGIVPGAPDLAVTKGGPASVNVGQTFAYTIDVTNTGDANATGVVVTDVLPAQVAFVSSSSTQGSCTGTSTVTCTIGTLTPGSSATITLNVTAIAAGPISNTASALADQVESDPGDNAGTVLIAAAASGANIPTLSEWGLLALLLAIAGLAVTRMHM